MRYPKTDHRPSAFLWLAGVVSLVLPILGVATAIYGIFQGARGEKAGWYWAGVGVALIVVDLVIDVLWANPKVSRSDEPDLNRRGTELVGHVARVEEAIAPGSRGKVRAADTVWVAEGCAADLGARVRITGVNGTVLTVETI